MGSRYEKEPYQTDGYGKKKKKKGMTAGDVFRMILMLAALCVFVYSGWTLYGFYREYKAGSDEYDNLESSYAAPETELGQAPLFTMEDLEDDEKLKEFQEVQTVSGEEVVETVENGRQVQLPTMKNPINFDELIEVNPDIAGWLKVRALDISYPIVQAEDNDYYLHRTFEKEDNFAGCLFVNCDNRKDFTDQNTIIYGHNMKNLSMFGKLKQFNDEEVYNKSKFFWIFTPDFIFQYRIFSASVVNKTGLTYQVSFTEEEFQQFIDQAYEHSVADTSGVEVDRDDRVVTLSTCTGDDSTRFVVQGKLVQVYVSR